MIHHLAQETPSVVRVVILAPELEDRFLLAFFVASETNGVTKM